MSAFPRVDLARGTVVRYTPNPTRHSPNHCREAMAIVAESGLVLDTFWGSGGDQHVLQAVEIATMEVLFHLDDYDELDLYRHGKHVVRTTWETYAETDRERVTSQHGLQARYFVRKGAQPDHATQVANARAKVEEAKTAVRAAEQRLEWARQDLLALDQTVCSEQADQTEPARV